MRRLLLYACQQSACNMHAKIMHYVHLENMRVHANVSFCVQIYVKYKKQKATDTHFHEAILFFWGGRSRL